MKIEKKVLDMSLAGIFTAIIIAMSVVPFLGYIPLGFMNATIIHVPVIIDSFRIRLLTLVTQQTITSQ